MSFLKDIGAFAKGMSITFREMFAPTVVENYPDGPGPLKGAVFQERFRGLHVLQRDENGLEKCVGVPVDSTHANRPGSMRPIPSPR